MDRHNFHRTNILSVVYLNIWKWLRAWDPVNGTSVSNCTPAKFEAKEMYNDKYFKIVACDFYCEYSWPSNTCENFRNLENIGLVNIQVNVRNQIYEMLN